MPSLVEGHSDNWVGLVVTSITSNKNPLKKAALVALSKISLVDYSITKPYLGLIMPHIVPMIKDRNIPVKMASERAILALLHLRHDASILAVGCCETMKCKDAGAAIHPK